MQGADLRLFAHAAENRGDSERQMPRVSAHVLLDLHGQFARRREDQQFGAAPRIRREQREFRQDGQRERRRLARARLGDANEVVPRQNRRDGSGLDGRRLGITGFGDRLQYFGVKSQCAKWHKDTG